MRLDLSPSLVPSKRTLKPHPTVGGPLLHLSITPGVLGLEIVEDPTGWTNQTNQTPALLVSTTGGQQQQFHPAATATDWADSR